MGGSELAASVGQRLLWYLDHYRGADGALNCPLICRLRGPLESPALRRALDELTRRHEGLRTTFVRRGRHLFQVVHDPVPAPFELVDVSGDPDPRAAADRALVQELRRPIDSSQWPVRTTLWRLDEQHHVLCHNMHHLVSDGVSGSIVLRDLRFLGDRAPLPPIPWQYRHFTEWQESLAQSGALEPHRAYWRRQLAGLELAALPLSPSGDATRRAASETFELPADLVMRLRQLAREQRTTLFCVMLACYYALLSRITGQRDLAVASLYANRSRAELQNIVGFLANTVILRTRFDERMSFAELVRATHATVMEAFLHQQVPYHTLSVERDATSTRRADDVVFQMIADPMDRTRLAGADAELVVPDAIGSRFELELSLVLKEGRMKGVLFYNAARLESAWARAFVERFAALCSESTSRD